MIDFLTTVPIIFGKPANIWGGMILFSLIMIQIYLGIVMARGNFKVLRYHKAIAASIFVLAVFHAYYGIGLTFFGFKIK